MMEYAKIARQLIESSYSLATGDALSVIELVEACCGDEVIDQVLGDDEKLTYRVNRLTVSIREALAHFSERRISAPLLESEFVSSSFMLQFFDGDHLAGDIRDWRARHRCRPALERSLRLLDPTKFEQLCGQILDAVGCQEVYVTTAQKDDGVDVMAKLALRSWSDGLAVDGVGLHQIIGGIHFLVYGQAKRYSEANKVTQEEVQRLEGSWKSVRNAYFQRNLAKDREVALNRIGYRPADPVLLLMATTSEFTRGAHVKGKDLGVVLLDGQQIAHLLATLGLCIEEIDGSYRPNFDLLSR